MNVLSNQLCKTLLFSLMAAAPLAFAGKPDSLAGIDPDTLTLKESKKFLKSGGDVDDAFEDRKKVLITGYRIGFMESGYAEAFEKGETSQTSNFSGQDSVTYYMQYPDKHLTAIAKVFYDQALLQEIVEEAYADLQARLTAVGRELVDFDSLKNSQGYKDLELAKPNGQGHYPSTDNNGGLANIIYIGLKPAATPMWFLAANPLDQAGTFATVGNALSMKNIGPLKSFSVDGDAVIIDLTARVRPAWVAGIRPKMLRSASVNVDPELVVLPQTILVQTYKSSWVGNVPMHLGELRLNDDYQFSYGYDYAEMKVGDKVVDKSFFVPAYEKTTIVDIYPDREKFKASVMHSLKTMNATIALWAKENPADE